VVRVVVYLVGSLPRKFEGWIVVSAGSRTLARSQVVIALFGDPPGPQSRCLRSLDHRGMVSKWIMRECVVEAEEVVVVTVSCGVRTSRSIRSP